jgi:hypothetical protein
VGKFFDLLLDSFDNSRVAVSDIHYGDSGHEVDVTTAVYIPEFGAKTFVHNEGVLAFIGWGKALHVPFNNRPAHRPGTIQVDIHLFLPLFNLVIRYW